MNCILIDDEKNALDVLEIFLTTHFSEDIKIIGSFNNSEEGILAIKKLKPELLFLDIEMPFKNGFDVINETQNLPYKVIFTTAYSEFAIKAFKVSAVDYLLKPIDELELIEAVKKVLQTNKNGVTEPLKKLIQHFQQNTTQKIGLTIGDTLQFFDPQEIIRLESDSNYTHIYMVNKKKITTAKTLKDVEDKLIGLPFFRVHHSHLINTNHIVSHIKGNAGYVKMIDDSNIPISRSRKEEFMDLFRNL